LHFTFESAKTILSLRKDNPDRLQKELAPIMRELTCKLLQEPPYGPKSLEQQLLSAYHSFINPHEQGGISDDIFKVHKFINEKFKTLPELKYSEEEVNLELITWWEKKGYEQFINSMRKNAVDSGDIELAPLACYFRLNLKVARQEFTHTMYSDYGSLPISFLRKQEQHVIADLYGRGIIDHPENDLQEQLPINDTQEVLTQKLAAIPDLDKVLNYIEREDFEKGAKVPETWSTECLAELKIRSIISDGKFSMMDKDAVIYRCNALPPAICDVILQHAKKEPLPTVLLSNQKATHWDLLNANSAKKEENKEIKKEVIEYEKELLIVLKEKLADYKGEGSKWENWVKQQIEKLEKETAPLSQEKADRDQGNVQYTLSNDKKITVTIEEQIKLDEAYAKKLQSEEYESYDNPNKLTR